MWYTAILQYIAVCFLDEAITGHIHMMHYHHVYVTDNRFVLCAVCVCVCVCVCVHVFRGEKLLTEKPCWQMRGNFYVIVYMVASALCPV